jgi:hypothetical protein
MPPSEAGATPAWLPASGGPPLGSGAARSGPTRATPVLLLAIAGVLLVARIAFGIYEHAHPIVRPPVVQVPVIPGH